MAQNWALLTVELAAGGESLSAAARALNVPEAAIDPDFGLVPVDRERRLYAVQVKAEALPAASPDGDYRGPYSDPPIAPFGVEDD